jgi:hypothetical protein
MVVVVHKFFIKDKATRTKKTYLHLSLGPCFSVLYPCEPAIGGDPLLTMAIVGTGHRFPLYSSPVVVMVVNAQHNISVKKR